MVVSLTASAAIANDAELYWIAGNGDEIKIMSSALSLENDSWSNPKRIYQAKTELHSLAVATDNDGNKTLVWTERRQQKMVLMKMQLAAGASAWGQANIFNDTFNENFAATLVNDSNNQLWLFWSANKGGLDDVYLSKRSAHGWSSPDRIHAKNKVPDIVPSAYLDMNNNVVVEWDSYDFVIENYLTLSKTYVVEARGSAAANETNEESDLSLSVLKLPSSLSKGIFGIAHFPNNKFRQSELLTKDL